MNIGDDTRSIGDVQLSSQRADAGSAFFLVAVSASLVAVLFGCAKNGENTDSKERSTPLDQTTVDADANRDEQSESTIVFKDLTSRTGIEATYHTGRESEHFAILESLGGGLGAADFDRDGNIDLFFPGGGSLHKNNVAGNPSKMFRNRGGWEFNDISSNAGVATPKTYTHGCAIDDFDCDGFDDVLVTGYHGVQFFQNLGDGTFREIDRIAGLTDDRWSSSAAWGDLNGDMLPDLYITHYVNWSFENNPVCPSPFPEHPRDVCPPRAFQGVTDTVYFNNGNGTFSDVSQQIGLVEGGKGLGVLFFDAEDDGDLDIYVANDMVDNFLYLNDGSGQFTESGLLSGTATDFEGVANGSMGVAVCDYNGDLKPDLWVTNFEEETFALYRNDGTGNFIHASREARISALGGLFVGFGTAMADLDSDGDEDAVVANGHVIYFPTGATEQQEQLLLRNEGDGRFQRVIPRDEGYFSTKHIGRGLVLADLDNDNQLDLVVAHNDENAALLRNATRTSGSSIRMKLIGVQSSRSAVGARVVLETRLGKQLRQLTGGGSFLSSAPKEAHFGIDADDEPLRATITWPAGNVQEVVSFPTGRQFVVVETP